MLPTGAFKRTDVPGESSDLGERAVLARVRSRLVKGLSERATGIDGGKA
ncbi:MAG: hypothetical protein JO046_25360 [Solirubrobacterales bacterium]|nr:hypothetical protein [Solirubrobacterales bacterium]